MAFMFWKAVLAWYVHIVLQASEDFPAYFVLIRPTYDRLSELHSGCSIHSIVNESFFSRR